MREFRFHTAIFLASVALGAAGCSEGPDPAGGRDTVRGDAVIGRDIVSRNEGGAERDGSSAERDGSSAEGGAVTERDGSVMSTDAGPVELDGGGIYDDAGSAGDVRTGCDSGTGTPRPTGCVSVEVCGDGLDNNCNGSADEGCSCLPGSVQRCFLGPPGRRTTGACVDGMQTCQGTGEFGSWGACMGGISPRAEACDSLDNNCDGLVDEGLCCNSTGTCPAPGDPRIPTGGPFQNYTVRGADFAAGTAYQWTVTGGPCDQLLNATSRTVTYTLNGSNSTTATGSNLLFRPTLSGDYIVTLRVTRADGTILECTFIIPIRAPGLRVETCWDRTGSTDIDLWLHRPNNMNVFTNSSGTNTSDNCAYNNCRNASALNWGYAPTPGTACREPASGCNNPRLDIDNIRDVGVPENINVDAPRAGENFRVALNYYSGTGAVHAMVNIYCGGALRATYGGADSGGMHFGSTNITGFATSGTNASGSLWRVADVTMTSATECDLFPLHVAGSSSGYCIATNTDRSYAGNCSR